MTTEIRCTLQENDFLVSQLFQASNDTDAMARRRRNRWGLGISYLVGGTILAFLQSWFMAGAFLLIGTVWLLVYPAYSRWLYRRHYQRHVRKHMAQRFGRECTLRLEDDRLSFHDGNYESRLTYREISAIARLGEHYLLAVEIGGNIVIPRPAGDAGTVVDDFVQALAGRCGKEIADHSTWRWR